MAGESASFQVLLVEDDPGDAGLIRHALRDERFGRFEPTWVTSLGDAGERLEARTFDVVLLDLSLPDSTGLDTLRACLALAGETPVVIFTGHDDPELALQALDLGAQDYLVKGDLDQNSILRSLRHALARFQADQALGENRRLLKTLMQAAKDAMVMVAEDGRVSLWNTAAELIFGYTEDEAVDRFLGDLIAPQRFRLMYEQALAATARLGQGARHGQTMEIPARHKEGRELVVELSLSMFRSRASIYLVSIIRDITERKAAERDLRLSRFSLEKSVDSIFWIREDGGFDYVNPAACRNLGYSMAELKAMGVPGIDPDFTPEIWPLHWRDLKNSGHLLIQSRHRRKDGTIFPVELSLDYLHFESEEYNVAQARDISERVAAEEELKRLAHTDGLTGLYNRRAFTEGLEQEIARQKRYGKPLTVMMMDLDHFKKINDAYGHAGGDDVLRHFAEVLRQTIRETDIPGRLGGEEFAVLLPETDAAQGVRLANRLGLTIRSASVETDAGPVSYTVSIGLSQLAAGDTTDTILARADQVLYRAKEGGRDRVEVAA
ncbi:diguanylate cyclase [Desulfonatronum thioautotrophicum]|uniref:diguanylate cyclase n=1 Tax=Desulfonatronum thioautotrophicum TaxID=617001 RepID=UPI00069C557B|nr:diguanylate cyclase [Desulfonatronum thioautotrophicum]